MTFPLPFAEFALLAVLTVVLAIDDRAGWQSLLAHPVFVAIPVGLIFSRIDAALLTGVSLELVWLSILPMRGSRRADTVGGAVVGVGTTCILLQQTGDPRMEFMVAAGVFAGLVVGQAGGYLSRWLDRRRQHVLDNFELPDDRAHGKTVSRLAMYHFFSVGYVALAHALIVLIALPLAVLVGDRVTAIAVRPVVTGASYWIALLPALGAASIIQHNWYKDSKRFLVLSAVIVLVVLWVR